MSVDTVMYNFTNSPKKRGGYSLHWCIYQYCGEWSMFWAFSWNLVEGLNVQATINPVQHSYPSEALGNLLHVMLGKLWHSNFSKCRPPLCPSFNQPSKLSGPHPTAWAHTFNLESLASVPCLSELNLLSVIFYLTWSNTLRIHSHTCFAGICLSLSARSYNAFGMEVVSSWSVHICPLEGVEICHWV